MERCTVLGCENVLEGKLNFFNFAERRTNATNVKKEHAAAKLEDIQIQQNM